MILNPTVREVLAEAHPMHADHTIAAVLHRTIGGVLVRCVPCNQVLLIHEGVAQEIGLPFDDIEKMLRSRLPTPLAA